MEADRWQQFQEWIDAVEQKSASTVTGMLLFRWVNVKTPARGTEGVFDKDPSFESKAEVMPLRVSRLLRCAALEFADATQATAVWHQTGRLLIVGLASDEPEASLERLGYMFRGWITRIFSSRPLKNGVEGHFRYGQAPIKKFAGRGPSQLAIESNFLDAWSEAWGRSEEEGSILRAGALARAGQASEPIWQTFDVRYAPVVSLLDGSVYGYEAVPYRRSTGRRWPAEAMFAEAESMGALYECDRSFREAAIRGLSSRKGNVKLFLPVPASIIYDSRLYPGTTLRRIEAAGLRPEHVVLQFEGRAVSEGQEETLLAALRHYRLQGFRISVSGITPERESLVRLAQLQPDYAQVEAGWIGSMARPDARPNRASRAPGAALAEHAVDDSLLGAIATMARKEQVVLIVRGLASESQIGPLVSAGIVYGQGNWVGEEEATPGMVPAAAADRIRREVRSRYKSSSGALSDLTLPVAAFSWETPVSEIAKQFEWQREAHGFIIADKGKPIGLLMKDKLHQLLSGQFGLPLYWNRPVGKIMDTQPMIVDEMTPIDQVSQMAMAREPDKLYDAVIVTRGGEVAGISSIRALLEWVTHARMADAQWANPLTGLPGNEPIRRELVRRVSEGRPFAVLYADLDHFKWFNDHFGFHRGDDVIRFTGETMSSFVSTRASEESFVGHIGGDDFIAVWTAPNPVDLAEELLASFARGIDAYADPLARPVTDREGNLTEARGLTLSLALLICKETEGWTPESLAEQAARLKKAAKARVGHTLVWQEVDSRSDYVVVEAGAGAGTGIKQF